MSLAASVANIEAFATLSFFDRVLAILKWLRLEVPFDRDEETITLDADHFRAFRDKDEPLLVDFDFVEIDRIPRPGTHDDVLVKVAPSFPTLVRVLEEIHGVVEADCDDETVVMMLSEFVEYQHHPKMKQFHLQEAGRFQKTGVTYLIVELA